MDLCEGYRAASFEADNKVVGIPMETSSSSSSLLSLPSLLPSLYVAGRAERPGNSLTGFCFLIFFAGLSESEFCSLSDSDFDVGRVCLRAGGLVDSKSESDRLPASSSPPLKSLASLNHPQ